MIFELIDYKYFPDDFKTRRKDTFTTAEDNCNKCRGLEQLLSVKQRVTCSKNRHEDQDESSISSSSNDVKRKTKSNNEKNNPEIEMLCSKINDYIIAKDQEKNVIDNLKEQLKHNEEEVNDLRNRLREAFNGQKR